jgi:hypothetical protein
VQSADSDLAQSGMLEIGRLYTIEYKVSGRSAGTVNVVAGTTAGTARSADGVYIERLRCAGNTKIILRADLDFVGSVEYVKVHCGEKINYDSQPERWNPTLAVNTSANGRLSNTDFWIHSGNWTLSEVFGTKWVTRAGTGHVFMPWIEAYGSLYFKIKPQNLGTNYFLGTLSGKLITTDASQNGYILQSLVTGAMSWRVVTAGVGTAVFTTGVGYLTANTPYEICITRTSANVWTGYIRGGIYIAWTQWGSGTDSTYTTCKYMVAVPVNTEAFSDVRHYPGVLDLSTLPI